MTIKLTKRKGHTISEKIIQPLNESLSMRDLSFINYLNTDYKKYALIIQKGKFYMNSSECFEQAVRKRIEDLKTTISDFTTYSGHRSFLEAGVYEGIPVEVVRKYKDLQTLYKFNNTLLLKIGKAPNIEQ